MESSSNLSTQLQSLICRYFEIYRTEVRDPFLREIDSIEADTAAAFGNQMPTTQEEAEKIARVMRILQRVRSEIDQQSWRVERLAVDGPPYIL